VGDASGILPVETTKSTMAEPRDRRSGPRRVPEASAAWHTAQSRSHNVRPSGEREACDPTAAPLVE
jgi:hypothetical protein